MSTQKFPLDFVIAPPGSGRPTLVEIKQSSNGNVIEEFKKALDWYFAPIGMLFTPEKTIVFIRNLSEPEVSAVNYDERTVETEKLLAGLRGGFEQRIEQWLIKLCENWDSAIPPDLTNVFIPEVVGNVAEGRLYRDWK